VIDNKGHLTQARYDNLGRRTHLDNPDTGLTEMVYDGASNLIRKITANLRAKNQAITYHYQRLESIDYPQFKENAIRIRPIRSAGVCQIWQRHADDLSIQVFHQLTTTTLAFILGFAIRQ